MVVVTSDNQVHEDDEQAVLAQPLPEPTSEQMAQPPTASITVTKYPSLDWEREDVDAATQSAAEKTGAHGNAPITPQKPEDLSLPEYLVHKNFDRFFGEPIKNSIKFLKGLDEMSKLPEAEQYQAMRDPGFLDAVSRTTLDLTTTGLATAPMKPGVGLFGGRMSQTAVKTAEKMEKEGFSELTIKEMTGLERGAENMWRKEISDHKSSVNTKAFKDMGWDWPGAGTKAKSAPLGKVFKHEDFYAAYPEARNIPVVEVEHIPGNKTATCSFGVYDIDGVEHGVILIKRGESDQEIRQTLIHELQHWIQEKEGFSKTSPASLPKNVTDAVKADVLKEGDPIKLSTQQRFFDANNVRDQLTPEQLKHYNDKAAKNLEALDYEVYRRQASEQEAFNADGRMNMTPKDRKQFLAKDTEEYPRNKQIVGNDKTGFAEYRYKPGEFVEEAAIKTSDGKIHRGTSHFEIVQRLTDDQIEHATDGFVTNSGQFINRQEALNLAKFNRQVPKDSVSGRIGALMSEDINGEMKAGLEASQNR